MELPLNSSQLGTPQGQLLAAGTLGLHIHRLALLHQLLQLLHRLLCPGQGQLGGIGPPLSLGLSLLQPLELPVQLTLLLSGLVSLGVAQLPFQGVNLPLQLFPPAVCSCQLLPSRSYGLLQLSQPLLLLGNLSVQLSLARQGSLHLA